MLLISLETTHSQVVKEVLSLREKIKQLSEENKKLQRGLNNRNEKIADLEFVIREIRKNNT